MGKYDLKYVYDFFLPPSCSLSLLWFAANATYAWWLILRVCCVGSSMRLHTEALNVDPTELGATV